MIWFGNRMILSTTSLFGILLYGIFLFVVQCRGSTLEFTFGTKSSKLMVSYTVLKIGLCWLIDLLTIACLDVLCRAITDSGVLSHNFHIDSIQNRKSNTWLMKKYQRENMRLLVILLFIFLHSTFLLSCWQMLASS